MSSTYVDIYGRKRDASTGRAILDPYMRPELLTFGGDALCISETNGPWNYRIPGLDVPAMGEDPSGRPFPTSYFITTPNMTFIPETTTDPFEIRVRVDGRYAEADFTICPQWYFDGTYYLPYIRKKPDIENLITHPYRYAWYDIQLRDFVIEPGSLVRNLGRIKKELAAKFTTMRRDLAAKIRVLETSTKFTGMDLAELRYANQGMLFASVILTCAPQTFNVTVLTVTGFQRYFLEALACYEYLTIYRDRPLRPDDKPHDVELGLMGCFTSHLDLAEKFYRQGIPVWLVRTPAQLPGNVDIHMNPLRTRPPMKLEFMSGSQVVFAGHASAVRNRACQAMKLGNITLGHGAYVPLPGDFNAQYIPDRTVYKSYSGPLGPSSSTSTSTSMPDGSTASSSNISSSSTSLLASSSTSPAVASSSTSPAVASSAPPSTSMEMQLTAPALQKVINTFAVNHNKFSLVPNVNSPRSNDVWVSALKSVHVDVKRVWNHDGLLSLRGYAFPDPFILINGGLQGRGLIYFFSWLSVRAAWLTEASAVDNMQHPGVQEWKDFLYFKVGRVLAFVEQASAPPQLDDNRRKSKRQRTTDISRFTLDLSDVDSNLPIQWNGVVLAHGGNPNNLDVNVPRQVLRQVAWDLFEHNFNFELLALDRSVHPRKYMSPHAALNRDAMVAACIPDGSFVRNDLPTVHRGLGASSWIDRWEYVEALRVLLLTWPGPPSEELSKHSLQAPQANNHTACAAKCLQVENIAYRFYCQTFFEYFGRAATTPHQLPV